MFTMSGVVTLFSLALAATMTLVAWRVVREERRRADARVAALAMAIHDEPGTAAIPGASRPWPLRFAIVAVIAAAAAAMALAGSSRPTGDAAPPQARTDAAAHVQTVALVALTHERMGRAITVQGAIREPDALAGRLEALVTAYDDQGKVVTSARARVERATAADGRARFTLLLPDSDAVARYRVSFRDGEQVIPHVDERS